MAHMVLPSEHAPAPAADQAGAVAQAILAGFDRHYGLFRYNAQQAKARYEAGDWHGIRRLARERIDFYDARVSEAVARIEGDFAAIELAAGNWQHVKQHYVALLTDHRQPELAETFFNSVCAQLLHRTYFHNDFIFVRPAVATDYLDADPPSYRAYYPRRDGLLSSLRRMTIEMGLAGPYVDIERDLQWLMLVLREGVPEAFTSAVDSQFHVLRTLFFRNKGAYVIGRFVAEGEITPFAIPVLQDRRGRLYFDALLCGTERIEALFNFSRAYFMVDMEVPSAYVRFLKSLMPTKPDAELYSMLGLHKQGKTAFYRDLLHHLRHSTDHFVLAPGIKGLVMGVFTLPSFPYVFKIIKDTRQKDISREFVKSQYQRVKTHDRVGRMADTWEYSDVPLPKDRLDAALRAELERTAPSLVEEDGAALVIKHVYIERRMIPLNLYLEQANDTQRVRALMEYGDAIKQMVAANIFPGDMLYKNFGVTRQGRVVFYDYDEVAYVTDCNFRTIPPPRTPEDDMAAEPWYAVGPHDVFPEEFATFLLGDPQIRQIFMHYHGDLLDAGFWQRKQAQILAGQLEDVFPYPDALRFVHRFGARSEPPPSTLTPS